MCINLAIQYCNRVAIPHYCQICVNEMDMQITDPEDKVYDVSEGIVAGINYHCPHCELSNDDITQGEFQCFPGSPGEVTFRGKVHDRAQATAREVIYYMEQWITSSDSVSIPVHHARLSINSTCVVLIASLDDPECPGYLRATQQMDTTTTTSSSCGTDDTLVTTSQPDQKPSTTNNAPSLTSSVGVTDVTSDITSDQKPTTRINVDTTTTPSSSGGTDGTSDITSDQKSSTRINVNNAPSIQSSNQFDTRAVVGGAVAIVFIITTGLVIVLVLYIILKYHQKTQNER